MGWIVWAGWHGRNGDALARRIRKHKGGLTRTGAERERDNRDETIAGD